MNNKCTIVLCPAALLGAHDETYPTLTTSNAYGVDFTDAVPMHLLILKSLTVVDMNGNGTVFAFCSLLGHPQWESIRDACIVPEIKEPEGNWTKQKVCVQYLFPIHCST